MSKSTAEPKNKMNEEALYSQRYKRLLRRKNVWKVLVNNYFQSFFQKKDTVLDLGSGYCEFINVLSCKRKYALDKNKSLKKFVNKNTIPLIAASTKIPLAANSVDKIFVSNLFEHLTKEDTIKTINEISRVLKKGGKVIILQPNIRFLQNDYWQFFDHITPVDDRALVEAFGLNSLTLLYKRLKFLPYTMSEGSIPDPIFVKFYLRMPFLWNLLGKQSLLIFQK